MKIIGVTISFSQKTGDSIPSFDLRAEEESGATFWIGRNVFTSSEATFLLVEQGASVEDARDRVEEAMRNSLSMLTIRTP